MIPQESPRARDANDEEVALVETLHKTTQRLQELTAGEIDSVLDPAGRHTRRSPRVYRFARRARLHHRGKRGLAALW